MKEKFVREKMKRPLANENHNFMRILLLPLKHFVHAKLLFHDTLQYGIGSALVSLKTILLRLAKGGAIAMVENVNFKQAEVMPRLV